MFALVDCNNFYASCERVFRPDLNGKPVVVLSNNDGCVIARSNEAKSLGIAMGSPAFEFSKFFEENNVQVFSANFALYGDMSHRVMSILSDYASEMEIYSIDECFLKLDNFKQITLENYSQQMRNRVSKWTGIPISIGLAPTKALAKVANRIAKKFPERTNGVYSIDTEEKRIKALKWLKIEDIWGVGRQFTKKLNSAGVKTAFDFTQLDKNYIKKLMTITGSRLQYDLQGISVLDLEEAKPKKNIATTRSFETNYTEFEQLQERVVTFAASCAEKLRHQNSCCNSMLVFIDTNRHRSDLPQYSRNVVIKLPFPTNSTIELAKFATMALKHIFMHGYSYKKAGVIVQDFTPEMTSQQGIFENRSEKHLPIMRAIDKINQTFGKHSVCLASQDPKRVWKMRQEKLSPRYTTKLSDIIIIKV